MKLNSRSASVIIISGILLSFTALLTFSYFTPEEDFNQYPLLDTEVNQSDQMNFTEVDITYGARASSYNISDDDYISFNNRNDVDMNLNISSLESDKSESFVVAAESEETINLFENVDIEITAETNESAPGTTIRVN